MFNYTLTEAIASMGWEGWVSLVSSAVFMAFLNLALIQFARRLNKYGRKGLLLGMWAGGFFGVIGVWLVSNFGVPLMMALPIWARLIVTVDTLLVGFPVLCGWAYARDFEHRFRKFEPSYWDKETKK